MSANINLTGELRGFFNEIEQHWTRKRGLFLTLVFELLLMAWLWDRIGFHSRVTGLLTIASVGLITTIVWLISSKRVLFRCGGLVLLWLVLSIGIVAVFYFMIYHSWIEGSSWDLPFIHIWGSLLLFIAMMIVGYLVDGWLFQEKKLMIVFAVNNESVVIERTIRASIEPVVQRLHDEDNRIRIIILPFGNIKSVRIGERFIKFPLTRADAIIYASVVDDSDSPTIGYVFTGFSSRINEKRFVREEQRGTMHNAVLDVHLRFRDWNYVNLANDNCSRKIAISKNLEDMLRMYIGCMYLMKHDFKAALPYTNSAIYQGSRNDPSYGIASSLFSYSILSSARVLENDERDFDAALGQLNQLVSTMPVANSDPAYNKAMARVMFYKGDIKASESFTKKFKDLEGHRWGYELNMGFYAIYKKKVLEFVQHYKNLRKYDPCEKGEVDFAIHFLERQAKESEDKEYIVLLRIAIAYLTLYKNPKKAQKKMERIGYKSSNVKSIKAISDIKEIVATATHKWSVLPRKK